MIINKEGREDCGNTNTCIYMFTAHFSVFLQIVFVMCWNMAQIYEIPSFNLKTEAVLFVQVSILWQNDGIYDS
jgi:hypothetical protein